MTRRRGHVTGSTPVVLPRVIIRPTGSAMVAITIDDLPVSDAPIPQVQLGEAISQIVDQAGMPIRVEVHDPDGTVYADILTPTAPSQAPVDPVSAAEQPRPDGQPSPIARCDDDPVPLTPSASPSRSPSPSRRATGGSAAPPDPYLAGTGHRRHAMVGAASRTPHAKEPM